jgi:hypothetical protein
MAGSRLRSVGKRATGTVEVFGSEHANVFQTTSRHIARFKVSFARLKLRRSFACELQGLQEFLKSETERVQSDIDNALAGLKIIIDTISPWRAARADTSVQERISRPEPRLQRSNLAGGQK